MRRAGRARIRQEQDRRRVAEWFHRRYVEGDLTWVQYEQARALIG